MKTFRTRRGSSLAESMVALGLIVMGLLGIVVLYTRSLSLNRDVVNRTIAAGLAAEGIEVVKNIVDTRIAESGGWTVGNDTFEITYGATSYLPESGLPLRFNAITGTYDYNAQGTPTLFSRTLSATSNATEEEYTVTSLVEWNERGTLRTVEVEDHFFNWRP